MRLEILSKHFCTTLLVSDSKTTVVQDVFMNYTVDIGINGVVNARIITSTPSYEISLFCNAKWKPIKEKVKIYRDVIENNTKDQDMINAIRKSRKMLSIIYKERYGL